MTRPVRTGRRYTEAAAAMIAYEVVERGRSDGWMLVDEDIELAIMVETHLAPFNIGCLDSRGSAWAHVQNGSRRFRPRKSGKDGHPEGFRTYRIVFGAEGDACEFAQIWSQAYGVLARVKAGCVEVSVPPYGPKRSEIEDLVAPAGGRIDD